MVFMVILTILGILANGYMLFILLLDILPDTKCDILVQLVSLVITVILLRGLHNLFGLLTDSLIQEGIYLFI